jgi:hypothetical protein
MCPRCGRALSEKEAEQYSRDGEFECEDCGTSVSHSHGGEEGCGCGGSCGCGNH